MNARRDPDRLIHAFLLEGQTELADQVYDAVRSVIEQKRQRVVIGPWRTPIMNKLVPIGLGAAAVVAVLFLGSRFIGSPSSNVGGPSATPQPSGAAQSTAPSSTFEPSSSRCRRPAGRPSPLLSEGTDGGVSITVTIAATLLGGVSGTWATSAGAASPIWRAWG